MADRASRQLIVNADDLGQSPGVNRGVAVAHDTGIVRSASVMVRWDAAPSAFRDAARSGLDLGLHLDLGEWAFEAGRWRAVYEVVDLQDESAVHAEVHYQADVFVQLRGTAPSHVDTHQHVHRRPGIAAAARSVADRFGVPLRDANTSARHCGAFYGQTAEGAPRPGAVSVEALVGLLADLLPGATELVCHPGLDVDLDTMYREERAVEVATLCDERVRRAIDDLGIDLCSFAMLA